MGLFLPSGRTSESMALISSYLPRGSLLRQTQVRHTGYFWWYWQDSKALGGPGLIPIDGSVSQDLTVHLDKLPVGTNSRIMRTRNSFMFTDFQENRQQGFFVQRSVWHRVFQDEPEFLGAISVLNAHFNPHRWTGNPSPPPHTPTFLNMEFTVTECSITSHPPLMSQDVSSQKARTISPWAISPFGSSFVGHMSDLHGTFLICSYCSNVPSS